MSSEFAPGDALGDLRTRGRTVSGRFTIDVNGRRAGEERWRLRRTVPGVEATATVEIVRPVHARYQVALELDTNWRPSRLQVVSEGPDATRSGEYQFEGDRWRGKLETQDGETQKWSGELGGDCVFDFGATILHFNTMWMERSAGSVCRMPAVLVGPDLTPKEVVQEFRFIDTVPWTPPGRDRTLDALQQVIVTPTEGAPVYNHYWTLPNGVPVRSLVVTPDILFELELVEFEGAAGRLPGATELGNL